MVRLSALALLTASIVVAAPVPKGDKPPAEPAAHFRFDDSGKNEVKGGAEFDLTNTEFKEKALYLNGQYDRGNAAGGYRVVCKAPNLDYDTYSVALRVKAEEFGDRKSNLFTGGTSYRWFGLERSAAGNLVVTLNNGRFRKEVEGAALKAGEWVVVACAVDVPGRAVTVAVNGKKVAVVDLPKDFAVEVAKSKARDADKVWSFTNYSNGNVFHGLVDELLIYGQALTADELAKVPLKP